MQQYMLLIHDQDVWETLSGDEQHAIDEEYSAFIRELRDHGRFVSTHELQPKTTAQQCASARARRWLPTARSRRPRKRSAATS